MNNISIWKKKSGGRFFNQVEKNTIFNHLHASTGCTTKNKIITKKCLCKIIGNVCHYTSYIPCNIYILYFTCFKWHKNRTGDKASTMSRKFLALRFRVVWRIPLASISRGYKWIAWPIPLFNSPNYKRFFYRLLIQHQYSEMLYKDSAFWGIKMTIINYIHHEAHLLVFIFWNCISHFE